MDLDKEIYNNLKANLTENQVKILNRIINKGGKVSLMEFKIDELNDLLEICRKHLLKCEVSIG